jgi:hypothetical protein
MLIQFSSPRGGGATEPAPPLRGTPYQFLGPRPFREARLRSYLVAQHRAGRRLASILEDPYVRRCGTKSFCWSVLVDPRTIEAFERNIHAAFEEWRA